MTTGPALLPTLLGQEPEPCVPDPSCVAAQNAAYNAAYNQYLIDHWNWEHVLMPQWRNEMDTYFMVTLPQHLPSVKSRGALPWSRPKLPPDRNYEPMVKDPLNAAPFNVARPFNNPNLDLRPGTSETAGAEYYNRYGFRSYANFNTDHGRNLKPDGVNFTPLANASGHGGGVTETIGDAEVGTASFFFSPREQPLHSARRAIMQAVKIIESRNRHVDPSLRDRVALVTFDLYDPADAAKQPVVAHPLSDSYNDVMQTCAQLQSVGDREASTALEPGLIVARDHMNSAGRQRAEKWVIILTDGAPNRVHSATTTGVVNGFISGLPGNRQSQFYGSPPLSWPDSQLWFNAALRQVQLFADDDARVIGVGLGFAANADFLQRISVLGRTNQLVDNLVAGSDPATYEAELVKIFKKIIEEVKPELVD